MILTIKDLYDKLGEFISENKGHIPVGLPYVDLEGGGVFVEPCEEIILESQVPVWLPDEGEVVYPEVLLIQ